MTFDTQEYEAESDPILKAADWLEANPRLLNFHNIYVPDCGTPGCALGWIAYFAGIPSGSNIAAAELVTGMPSPKFYKRMTQIAGSKWQYNVLATAAGLRKIAHARSLQKERKLSYD